jgi:redox-sensing transcriptional repressor
MCAALLRRLDSRREDKLGTNPNVPRPSVMRLPHYYRRLLQAIRDGQRIISSQELGEEVGVPAAQARRDLSYLGEAGRPGVGYNVQELAARLEQFLGLTEVKEAVLVGTGNLGRALASYPGFARYRLHIAALFDRDPAKLGTRIGLLQVYPMEELAPFVRERGIKIGILAVPAPPAQAIAEQMAEAGIRAIWNFAPVSLQLPPTVMVFNEDLAARLATVSYYIAQRAIEH